MIEQPRWSGTHPDYIVLRATSEDLDRSMEGEWLDRRQMPYLEAAIALHGMKITPSPEFEIREEDGCIAQVWELSKQ